MEESAKSLASVTAYVEEQEETVPETALSLASLNEAEQKYSSTLPLLSYS